MMYTRQTRVLNLEALPDPREEWTLGDKIGRGTYGEVFSAKHKQTGEVVAMKVMDSALDVIEEIEEEFLILRDMCHHPNLPRFYALYFLKDCAIEDQLWMSMELCSCSVTDVAKGLKKRGERLEEPLLAYILHETLKGLDHLHKNCVMHRDVKGNNILITAKGEIKLVDFGVSAHVKEQFGRRNTSVGTPFWMAPEVVACEQQLEYSYDVRCDIWSLGITAIELADGKAPLAGLHPMKALFQIPRNPPPTFQEPDTWSENFRDFVSKCLVKDFEERQFAEELLQHPFIQSVSSDTNQIRTKLQEQMGKVSVTVSEPPVTRNHGRLRSRPRMLEEQVSSTDDLATLENLEEKTIVLQLQARYNKDAIYTYMGDILLALNPFKPLPIYDEEYSRKYRNASKAEYPPHIFAVADHCFQAFMHTRHNQCIVISGESGSGKTMSANFLVQQLTILGKAPNRDLEERILKVNPLVEAFGNAQTKINNNSSRFGKYLEMTFTEHGKVTGAVLSEYLLEKARVAHQAEGERNFHIFYYIHDGLFYDNRANKYALKENKTYRYLNGYGLASATEMQASVNRVKFKAIQTCFQIIGFKSQEVSAVYSVLAGLLHAGNLEFMSKEIKHQNGCSLKNENILSTVAELLGIDSRELCDALTTSGMVARGETIVRQNTASEASNMRDAMANAIYSRLFSWIVTKINQLLKPPKKKKSEEESVHKIGILDIFGFENLSCNSFEQLCINIANEQIQYYFNQHIFAWEQEEYKNEGIDASSVVFLDNRPILDMFLMKPLGLLALLDEESNFPGASDSSLIYKFDQNVSSQHYIKNKAQGVLFGVQHYAGKVEYDATGFLEKNRDRLAPELVNILRLSQIALMRTLFHTPVAKTGNLAYTSLGSTGSSALSSPDSSYGSKFSIRSATTTTNTMSQARSHQTLTTYFRYSLMDLLGKMVTGTPHFVRCIRPNKENGAGYFDEELVRLQLQYTGVLETTRIRRQGFSHRIPFSEFLKRYGILGFKKTDVVRVNKENCQTLLEKLGLQGWALGNTKVFLKYYHVEQLTRRFEFYNHKVALAQAVVRMWVQRQRYKKLRKTCHHGALVIQKYTRGWLARLKYMDILEKKRKAATTIQKDIRRFLAQLKWRPILERRKQACVTVQTVVRGFLARRHFIKLQKEATESATTIQSAYRGYQVRKKVRLSKSRRRKNWGSRRTESKSSQSNPTPVLSTPVLSTDSLDTLPKEKVAAPVVSEEGVKVTEGSRSPLSSSSTHSVEWAAVTLQKYFRMWHAKAHVTKLQLFKEPVKGGRLLLSKQIESLGEQGSSLGQTEGMTTEELISKFGEEKIKKFIKAFSIKAPWTKEESEYYDQIAEKSDARAKRKTKLQSLMTKEGRAYYDGVAKGQNSSETGTSLSQSQEEQLGNMMRSALAATAAKKFIRQASEASTAETSTVVKKSESSTSLTWDAPLEKARGQILAPGPDVNTIAIHFGPHLSIDQDDPPYLDEFNEECKSHRPLMIQQLETQHKRALSTRFKKQQVSEEHRQRMEARWRHIHQSSEEKSFEEQPPVYKQMLKPTTQGGQLLGRISNKQDPGESKSGNAKSGNFSIRSHVKKVNLGDTLASLTKSVKEENNGTFDYRKLLKKTALTPEENRARRTIII